MSEELLPCPFCGGRAITHIFGKESHAKIYCERCDATKGWHDSLDDAKAAWNTRTAHKDTVDELAKALEGMLSSWQVLKDTFPNWEPIISNSSEQSARAAIAKAKEEQDVQG